MKVAFLSLLCAVIAILPIDAALPNFLSRWKATVKVVDDTGKPVHNSEVTIGYYVTPKDESIALDKKTGRTDTNGLFTASGPNSWELVISARKDGYYQAFTSCELGLRYDPVRWSPTSTLVLKKIVQPIPMFAKKINVDPPVTNVPVGFDFAVGDWVAPHGKGTQKDILFTQYLERRTERHFNYRLVVSFPNPGDGIQPFVVSPLDTTSALRSSHEAPAEGYKPEWTKSRNDHPGYPNSGGLDGKRNFFVRVKTVLDETGRVKTAHYGKIYGDFFDFYYYLNPTPNSRNVEFNPKKNLIKGHLPGERVNDP
jgi:hypothetical protein